MIVPAGLLHAAALAAIHAAAFPPAERWDAALIARLLAIPGHFAFIDPDGGMVLARVAADEAEILTFGVVPAARRRGLGRALLDSASVEAARRGAGEMFLEVAADNAAALALYAAAGFVAVGRRYRYYTDGSDALLLCRALSRDAAAGG
jgi:ribosomal-protein-alanine N-acetyltransferase